MSYEEISAENKLLFEAIETGIRYKAILKTLGRETGTVEQELKELKEKANKNIREMVL